jgi:GntR family transcriptional regulator, transcriptional repressor for pyruvate dehydrogenase complex
MLKDTPAIAVGFSPIAPQRAFEDIAAQIRELVANGKLKPGDRLPAERDLSAKFNVSRNTLREALRALELSGMIELRKGASGGAFVLPGNSGVVVNGLRDLYHLGAITPEHLTEARIWLSEVVVRVACERMTDEDIDALEQNVDAAARAQKAGDFDERARVHSKFHTILASFTRNPIIEITMEAVMEVMRKFIERIGPSDNPYTIPSRRRLIKHLRARDSEAAVAEMTKFLERLQAQYMALWNSRQKR